LDLRPLPFPPPHSLSHIFFVTSLLLNPAVFLVFLSSYVEEFPKKQILTAIYVAYCKILLKENGYKILQLYLIELDVS